jgi:hypothetical protein
LSLGSASIEAESGTDYCEQECAGRAEAFDERATHRDAGPDPAGSPFLTR